MEQSDNQGKPLKNCLGIAVDNSIINVFMRPVESHSHATCGTPANTRCVWTSNRNMIFHSYWCVLRREFSGMIHQSSLVSCKIIPATPTPIQQPYVKRTSKSFTSPSSAALHPRDTDDRGISGNLRLS